MKTLASFHNKHKKETILVCGCGPSLNELQDPERFTTIGVNDVGRLFDPSYLVVVNPRHQFKGDRFRYVETSRAKTLFSQLNLGIHHPHLVRFKLGKRGGTDFSDPDTLPYTQNSPYVALCLAAYMGAKRIGLIGVDFTDHHFFGRTGRHPLASRLAQIDKEYALLAKTCDRLGVEVVNLSSMSRLIAFPKMSLDKFVGRSNNVESLNVISYATTPVAGVPLFLARCISARTSYTSRCVWAKNHYGNGLVFQRDIEWTQSPNEAKRVIAEADLVIVHNGKVAPEHRALLNGKPIITMAHNYLWNVDQTYTKQGQPGVVVGQYQATLREFEGWNIVPNPMPLWEQSFQPATKPEKITICYTPSGKHERYPEGHRLYWHAKGYDTTMRVLEYLATQFPIQLHVIRNQQVAHAEAMAMKQRAHIVIDECVTGSYHRNSLEGLATGCVVINGMGILPEVDNVFHRCALTSRVNPFICANLENLEGVLKTLLESGDDNLLKQGMRNRKWMEEHWDFTKQWKQFWMPVIAQARSARKKRRLDSKSHNNKRNVIPSATKVSLSRRLRSVINETRCDASGIHVDPLVNDLGRSSSIPVYWTCRGNKRGNFGDMLSPLIVKSLSGRSAKFVSQGQRLFAVGSLLKFAQGGALVWGSGFIDAEDVCGHDIKIYAVRGPLTRDKLKKLGVDCPEVYGDPASLLPYLYRLPSVKRNGIGLIPHYVDTDRVYDAVRATGIRVIDIRAGVEEVLHQVNCCEVVLSSSLHGCIVAEAYGIPTAWVHISEKVVGGGFKFRDYYAATGREPVYIDWRRRINIDAATDIAVQAPAPILDLEPLLSSFPYLQSKINRLDDLPMRVIGDLSEKEAGRSTEIINRLKVSGLRARRIKVHSLDTKRQIHSATEMTSKPPSTSSDKDHRLAIFSCGTEDYTEYMVTSLRSFMKHNIGRRFDYYILGHAFSAKTHALLDCHGVHYINLNLGSSFTRYPYHRYPSECFWIFKGPELFHRMGYPYSLSVDGDTLCNRRLDLAWLPQVKHIAGKNIGRSVSRFLSGLGQYRRLKELFEVNVDNEQRIATNTGVIFYNNKALTHLGFYNLIVDIYALSESNGIVRGGDDSTLALLMAAHPEIQLFVLDELWNAFRGLNCRFSLNDPKYNQHQIKWIDDAYIVHLLCIKPWKSMTRFPNRVSKHFYSVWRALWLDTVKQHGLPPQVAVNSAIDIHKDNRVLRPQPRNTSCPIFPVRCYWYRGSKPNAGDEINPYLIRKIVKLSPKIRLRDTPRDPRKMSEPVLVSIGSVLRLCGRNTVVWGSGIRNIDQAVSNARKFCAVRGPITRRRLLQLGYDCPEIYGDPAILLPRYFRPTIEKRYSLGIIPHLVDFSVLSKLYADYHDVLIINLNTTDIEVIVKQILSCRCTISSALHGLVISIAYGVPTRWLKCSDKIMGDDTKFYDFFASLNCVVAKALDTRSMSLPEHDSDLEPYSAVRMEGRVIVPEELSEMTFKHEVKIDTEELLAACPIDGSGWKTGILNRD